ncbi:hypothetical protein [Actinomadura flavalba]|uniref:hypothetical protein n=1 Tax=Actinomadura flavalba TaxID=1120938 RepID=UPI0003A941B9|nr:hypothetical protein [Actinomadura flavalba]
MPESGSDRASAAELVTELARLRGAEPLRNPMLELARNGLVTVHHLRRVVLVEDMYHRAELAAYGLLLARFPHSPADVLLLDVARTVQGARGRLASVARSLGITLGAATPTATALRRDVAAHGFCGFVSWLAVNGGQSAMALALYSEPDGIYYGGGAAIVHELRGRGQDVPDDFAEYYTGVPSEEQNDRALEVVQNGLDSGESPSAALDAGRLCDQYMALLWTTAAFAGKGER